MKEMDAEMSVFHSHLRRVLSAILLLTSGAGEYCAAGVQLLQMQDHHSDGDGNGLLAAAESPEIFCVVSANILANIRLTFSNSSGPSADGQSWLAKNARGESLSYGQIVEYSDGAASVQVSKSASPVFVFSGQRAARSAASCGPGNMAKRVVRTGGLNSPFRGPYQDSVTVIASPE